MECRIIGSKGKQQKKMKKDLQDDRRRSEIDKRHCV
jgi:hypothetical protein